MSRSKGGKSAKSYKSESAAEELTNSGVSAAATSAALQVNLSTIRRIDPQAAEIAHTSSFTVVYKLHLATKQWERAGVEGTLFLYYKTASSSSSRFVEPALLVLNRLSTENFNLTLIDPIWEIDDDSFRFVFLCAQGVVYSFWFHDADEAKKLNAVLGDLVSSSESSGIGEFKEEGDSSAAERDQRISSSIDDLLFEEICKVLPSVESKSLSEQVISPDVLMKLASGGSPANPASLIALNDEKFVRLPSKQVFVKAVQVVLANSQALDKLYERFVEDFSQPQ